jgi:hypothetical protein
MTDTPGAKMAEYQSQVWRVNVREQTLKRECVPNSWKQLGGRGLLARILLDEVDAKCDPLGPGNKLIFAPGLLVGHMLSSTDRISVGGWHQGIERGWADRPAHDAHGNARIDR